MVQFKHGVLLILRALFMLVSGLAGCLLPPEVRHTCSFIFCSPFLDVKRVSSPTYMKNNNLSHLMVVFRTHCQYWNYNLSDIHCDYFL